MDFLRRSMLFLPGDNPRFLAKALASTADALILDLEDAVAPHQKPAARLAVAQALRAQDFGAKEKGVRINSLSTPYGREDVQTVVPARPHTLVVPKVNGPQDVQEVDDLVTAVEKAHGLALGEVKLMPIIESPLAVINVESIALASPRVVGLMFGIAFRHTTRGDRRWMFRPCMSLLSTFVFSWLIFYSALTIRKSIWHRG
ncbi:MAG: CoA ester lyase [Chloroflexota bacterium]